MVDGRAALAAEDTVDGLARGTDASPALGGARDGQLVLGDDSDESCKVAVLVNTRHMRKRYHWRGFGIQ